MIVVFFGVMKIIDLIFEMIDIDDFFLRKLFR